MTAITTWEEWENPLCAVDYGPHDCCMKEGCFALIEMLCGLGLGFRGWI